MRLSGMLRRTLLSRGGSMAAGLLALVALVWFGGPLLGLQGVAVRLAIIAVLVTAGLGYLLITWIIARHRGAQFKEELQAQQEGQGPGAEIAALRKKMEEAIASLKTSELGVKYRGSSALYALPWYMIIGPSAAGKSTLLRNSGLHFPYAHADDVDIRGFGGTRNCDWWFSDEAVILDTAGRYTTEENDRDEWYAFLNLLKKYRRKMPLNGAVVAISIADLLTADDESLEWHVQVVRERVNELTRHLGYVVPLYIVFTKCDLLNGFQAFFADMSDRERAQVWGSFLEIGPDADPTGIVEDKFTELYARLCQVRLRRLHMQRKQEIKGEIYDFPAQFQAATGRLLEFINLLFKDNPYQEAPNFRGVYFTSGTQEGTPLQRVVGNLRQAFGSVDSGVASSRKGSSKSYFIRRLLSDVIFKSPLDVSVSRRKDRVRRWVKTTAVFASIGLVAGTLTLLSAGFTRSALVLNQGVERVERLNVTAQDRDASRADMLIALGDVFGHYDMLRRYRDEQPWYQRIGPDVGEAQIEPFERLLVKSLDREFLARLGRQIESDLDSLGQRLKSSRDGARQAQLRVDYYELLKVYLMICQPQRIEESVLVPALHAGWRNMVMPRGNALVTQNFLRAHDSRMKQMVQFYVRHMRLEPQHPMLAARWRVSERHVAEARAALRTPPDAEVLYARLKRKGRALLKDQALKHMLTSRGARYLESDYRLAKLYTREGWEQFAWPEINKVTDAASRGDWVLGTGSAQPTGSSGPEDARDVERAEPGQVAELRKALRERYFADYSTAWFEFLGSISIRRDRSVNDLANKLVLFARPDGPVAELFMVLHHNIDLPDPEAPAPLAVALPVATSGAKQEQADGKDKVAPEVVLVHELDRPFRDLRRYTRPGEKSLLSDVIEEYLSALAGVQGEVERLRAASERSREAEMLAASVLSGNGDSTEIYRSWVTTSGLLNGTEARTRGVVEPILITPIRSVWGIVVANGMQEIQNRWSEMVVREYEQRIRGHFPFSRQGPDVALDDFAEFFRPDDGTLWAFVNDHLSPYLAARKGKWRSRSWMGIGPGFSKGFLAALARSEKISKAVFRRGSADPEIIFYLYPMPTTGLSEVLLESNGQTYRYRNEPQEWRRFSWPGEVERSGARIIGLSEKNNLRAELSADGLWGLFHLFSKARLVKERGAQYLSVWEMKSAGGEPVNVSFLVKADRHSNLLQAEMFRKYYLPERIRGTKRKAKAYAQR